MIIFKEGDQVILREDSGYVVEPCNPRWGTEYACVGTVSRVDLECDSHAYEVLWDNGIYNTYKAEDLCFQYQRQRLSKDNPNVSYRDEKNYHTLAAKVCNGEWLSLVRDVETESRGGE